MLDEKFLEHLENLALNATQGEWVIDESHLSTYGIFRPHSDPLGECSIISSGEDREDGVEFGIEMKEDAEYFAAINPAVILEMINAIKNNNKR